MIALTWRQHRAQLLTAAGLIAALSGYLLLMLHQMTSYMASIGLSTCLSSHGSCDLLAEAFLNRFGASSQIFSLLDLAPLLAGLFWGAPLIARETERGTHRMAWTQSVSRRRWLTVKLTAFAVATVLAATIIALLLAAWLHPFDQLIAAGAGPGAWRMTPGLFDLSGTMPAACALFAFALGTAAGALIRRTLPAMAVTLGGYLALWLPLQSARYRFITPLSAHGPVGSLPPVPLNSYRIASSYTTAAGRPVSYSFMENACLTSRGGRTGVPRGCFAAKGFQAATTYQPDSHFWPIQGIESGIFVAAAIALLAVTAWWVSRRIS